MQTPEKIRIPFATGAVMLWNYFRGKVTEQIWSVAFVVIYLFLFQRVFLDSLPAQGTILVMGIGMVVIGLSFFLEGLMIGLMPLGEKVGLQLPRYGGLIVTMLFGLLLGFGTTLAEPAIAALRVAGAGVTAWDTPLLFLLLEKQRFYLVVSIGLGVGIAVALGMLRFFKGFSLKPFVYSVLLALLGVSGYCATDENLATILGLAWDTGAVTTGAVTVPLVLALGIGVSRASGRQKGSDEGLGIIALASAYPVLAVLALGIILNQSTPQPLTETEFFSLSNRGEVLKLFSSEAELAGYAFQRAGAAGRKAFFGNLNAHAEAVRSLSRPESREALLGRMTLAEWLSTRASTNERLLLQGLTEPGNQEKNRPACIGTVMKNELTGALQAVIPLTILLLLVLGVVLRDSPRHKDEVMLGITMTLVGMTVLTGGIHFGLAPLGNEVGRQLPRLFRTHDREEGCLVIENFSPDSVLTGFNHDGKPDKYFYLFDNRGIPALTRFQPERYNPTTRQYEHIFTLPPLFGPKMTFAGILLILVFAFGLGYSSTLAEPALAALGRTVEEISIGTIKAVGVVRAVSIGVGIGLVAGVARIIFGIPTIWLIVPPYLLLFPLTHISEEDFAGIAWDSGGVTTGVITVPLILAMGLAIGGELQVKDGFGILAMASVYPIISVLLYGILVKARQRRSMEPTGRENKHD